MNNALIAQELEASRRVRTKLATSDDAALPHVLSLLLPRLLRKMDANRDDIISNCDAAASTPGEFNAVTPKQLRASIHEEYLGVINHAVDRIEILRDNVDVVPILQSITAFVAEIASNLPSSGGKNSYITPGLRNALRILKICFSKWSRRFRLVGDDEMQSNNNLDILISVLKASISTMERMDNDDRVSDVDYAVSGWLVLDSISLFMSIGNGNSQINNDQNYYKQRYATIVAAIKPLAKGATYNLFLDLILYQPNGTGNCGLSTQGIGRMQSHAPIANSSTREGHERFDLVPSALSCWNELKLVVLKIATGTVKGGGGGVFGWEGGSDSEGTLVLGTARAITLLVLSALGQGLWREKHALQIAAFAKASCHAYKLSGEDKMASSLFITQKRARGRKSQTPRSIPSEEASAVVRAALMLLCLALGEVEACAAIRRHNEKWNNDNSSGSISNFGMIKTTCNSRSPLSEKKTHAILCFVIEHLDVEKGSIKPVPSHLMSGEKAQLISLALHVTQSALRLNEENDAKRQQIRMHVGWGDGNGAPVCASQLLVVLGEWLNACIAKEIQDLEYKNRFVELTCRQIFDMAFEILNADVLPLLRNGIAWGINFEEGDQLDDAPVEYRQRGRLARERRVLQNRQNRLVPPLEIRKCCIDLIRKLARYSTERDNFFDVPVLLFNCLEMDEELSPHVAVVLEELREVYKPFVAMYRSKMEESYLAEDRLIQSATPLLPVLITASTSALIQRRLTVKWSEDIVRPLDELAARVLCARLASDSDKVVSTHANKVVNSIEAGEAINNVRSRVMFFDSEDVLDMEVVATMLDREIEAFGEKLQISRDGAALIMQNNQYSFDKSLEKIQKSEDLERTLDACGVKHRCRSLLHRKDSNDDACSVDIVHQCKICFDDKLSQDDLYSLPCRHRFCRECFKSYLRVKMEDRSLLNCPQHGCNERIVEDDVKELLPSMLKDWKEIHLKHFIKISDQYTHCPGSDCGMICYSDTKTRDAQCTKCGRSFCFCCGNNPHTPATCRDAKEFLPLLDSSEYYVMKCSKRCPGPNCLIPIEKNQGCNYMTCSECNTSFCWLCLQPLGGHDDLERHACNKFDPRHTYNTKEKDEFFLSRYESSAEGEVYAKKGLDTFLKEKANADLCSDDDIRAMVKASECLIQCRNFLKNTYIVAWVWHHDVCRDEKTNETSATRKEIFEAHQATLAAFTDNLQQLLEKDASVIDLDGFAFFTFALRLYVERMMEFISRCREDVSR